MTTEEKAKAYDEAYAKAKELLENAHAFCKYDMEIVPEFAVEKAMCKIFPELIDDQDIRERIRVEWLEKQRESLNDKWMEWYRKRYNDNGTTKED